MEILATKCNIDTPNNTPMFTPQRPLAVLWDHDNGVRYWFLPERG